MTYTEKDSSLNGGQDVRERLIHTAMDLVLEELEVEKITVRRIAQCAGVSIGSINYHFESKDKLLLYATKSTIIQRMEDAIEKASEKYEEPADQLKYVLKSLFLISEKHEQSTRFILTQEILHGDMLAPLYLMPILSNLYKGRKQDVAQRILALQIIQPLQLAAIAPKAFLLYSGVDIYDTNARDEFIDMLIEHLPESL